MLATTGDPTGAIGSLKASTAPIVKDPDIASNTALPAQEPAGGAVQVPSGTCTAASTPEAPATGGLMAGAALAVALAPGGRGGEETRSQRTSLEADGCAVRGRARIL
jgi:hypothetical protein